MGDPFEKEDIVEGVDGRRERENSCRVSGLLEPRHGADCLQRRLLRCSRFRQRLSPSVQIDDTTTDSTSRKPHNAALVDIRDWVTMAQSLMDDAPCLDTTSLMSKDIVRLQILQPMT